MGELKTGRGALGIFRVREVADLERIPFRDGVAAVEVPAELLDELRFKNEVREDSARLRAVEASIRNRGFVPVDPIVARIGRKGKWVVVNGGHRLTAIRHVMRDWWANLFGRKVRTVYFLLYADDLSWTKGKVKGHRPPEG
ncbi:MAG: ParB N-terminal domain-containing protein [Pseudomonadota bacterium]